MNFSDSEIDFITSIPPARGRMPAPVSFTVVREISTDDIAQLFNPSTLGATTPQVKRLRKQHHTLARLLATTGAKQVEIAAITGYSLSRISILLRDPAFQDLVSYYSANATAQFIDVHARLAGLGEAVVEELQERLEADPEALSIKELLQMGEFTLDRSSAPPKSKTNVGPTALPNIKISFHSGGQKNTEQLTIETDAISEDDDNFL